MAKGSFARSLGGLVFSGYSQFARRVRHLDDVALLNAVGARAYEPSHQSTESAIRMLALALLVNPA